MFDSRYQFSRVISSSVFFAASCLFLRRSLRTDRGTGRPKDAADPHQDPPSSSAAAVVREIFSSRLLHKPMSSFDVCIRYERERERDACEESPCNLRSLLSLADADDEHVSRSVIFLFIMTSIFFQSLSKMRDEFLQLNDRSEGRLIFFLLIVFFHVAFSLTVSPRHPCYQSSKERNAGSRCWLALEKGESESETSGQR